MSDRRSNDDQFAERVARVLRETESFGDHFEDALIESIRADRPVGGTPRTRQRWSRWWSSRTISISPLTALAAAAGIAVAAAFGARPIAEHVMPGTPAAIASARRDTVTLVRFVFVGKATSVALVGDFNAWGGEPTALDQTTAGAWSALVPLSNGRHEYAFIVDGKRWTPDPLAPLSSDDFDTQSSIITVGT
ncbi:MAG TPA: glycogen-binding domain-containing protein [Gemmatimonadaceae bacterium]|nr:glycogen-binding domain-containing protein [Gemmatimonadaceae bacterium]